MATASAMATSGPELGAEFPGFVEADARPASHAAIPSENVAVWCFTTLYRLLASGVELLLGTFAILTFLAILATIPIVQFISLGYLLESGSRLGRLGWRHALPGVRRAARLGGAVLCIWLLAQPLRLISDLHESALLLDNATAARGLGVLFAALTIGVVWHCIWACMRGGRLRSFLWPAPFRCWNTVRAGGWYRTARDSLMESIAGFQLPRLFWLGTRGFTVAAIWLLAPISVLILSTRIAGALGGLCWFVGSIMLFAVLFYLPFAQMNFAVSGRFLDGFQVGLVRRQFQRAPVAFLIAALATFVLAVPLYALKAELLPREAAWLPSIVFVISIWPARMLTGWAIRRANHAPRRRHFVFRWTSFLAWVPLVLAYVGIVYVTQYISWYGAWSLYEQHTFLLPVPFMGL